MSHEYNGFSNHWQLFVQQFVQAYINENMKAPRHWSFVRGVHRWPVDSPHKGPVTRKMFLVMVSSWSVNEMERCERAKDYPLSASLACESVDLVHFMIGRLLCWLISYEACWDPSMDYCFHSGGHCWDFYSGALFLCQVATIQLKLYHRRFHYGCSIFQRVAQIWLHDTVPGW